MAAEKQDVGVATDRVNELTCSQCGCRIDTTELDSFVKVECPDCGSIETVPAKLGTFLLRRLLGTGGMGGVYLATDETLGRKVAIKVMLKSLGEDKEFIETFKREAQAVAKLNHPNIAQVYSFGKEKGQPYIVMELVSGERLDKMVDEQKLHDQGFVLKVLFDIASGLSAADEAGLVHGDIKPENILLDEKGRGKLVDFGLATVAHQSTAGGGIWGTPYYIPPEKVQRKKVDARSDIYSLGATAYHVLTGSPPFDGETPVEVVKARLNDEPPKISDVRKDIHPRIDNLVLRMMQLEPARRHPNYASLISDIKRAIGEVGPPKSGSGLLSSRSGKHIKLAKKKIVTRPSGGDKAGSSSSSTSRGNKTGTFRVQKGQSAALTGSVSANLKKKAKERGEDASTPKDDAVKTPPPPRGKSKAIPILLIILLLAAVGGGSWFLIHRNKQKKLVRREYFALVRARNSAESTFADTTVAISNALSMASETRSFILAATEAVELLSGEPFTPATPDYDQFFPGIDQEKVVEPPPAEEVAPEDATAEGTASDASDTNGVAVVEDGTATNETAQSETAQDVPATETNETTEPPAVEMPDPEAEFPEPAMEVAPAEPLSPAHRVAKAIVQDVNLLQVLATKAKTMLEEASLEHRRARTAATSREAAASAAKLDALQERTHLLHDRAKNAHASGTEAYKELLTLRSKFEKAEALRKQEEEEEAERQRLADAEAAKQRELEEKRGEETVAASTTREAQKLKLPSNSFEDAIAEITAAMKHLDTDEGKAAFQSILDSYQYMLGMKQILTSAINAEPFKWGWGKGSTSRDIMKVTNRGFVIKGVDRPYTWAEVSTAQLIKLIDHYLKSKKLSATRKAQLAFGAAVYCSEFGTPASKKMAQVYINSALSSGFSRRTQERLLPRD